MPLLSRMYCCVYMIFPFVFVIFVFVCSVRLLWIGFLNRLQNEAVVLAQTWIAAEWDYLPKGNRENCTFQFMRTQWNHLHYQFECNTGETWSLPTFELTHKYFLCMLNHLNHIARECERARFVVSIKFSRKRLESLRFNQRQFWRQFIVFIANESLSCDALRNRWKIFR